MAKIINKLAHSALLVFGLIAILAAGAAQASCCAHPGFVEFEQTEVQFFSSCSTLAAGQIPDQMLLLDSVELYSFKDERVLISHKTLGCIGTVEMRGGLSLMSRHSVERDEWVVFLSSNDVNRSVDVVFSDTLLRVNIE